MTARVDPIKVWGPSTIRAFAGGSCHLVADTLDELHAFAAKLGLKRAWFQPARYPHYDLNAGRREKAVKLGAVEVTSRELLPFAKRLKEEMQAPAELFPSAARSERLSLASAVEVVRKHRACAYTGQSRCDCKYGPEVRRVPSSVDPTRFRETMDYATEHNGCPELRVVASLLLAMTDAEYERISKRARRA